MARGAPRRHSYVRSISSGRHCVSTWIVTSSGIRSSSMSWRMKSKSGWRRRREADLDLLEAHVEQDVPNMRRLRSGSIGSMSAWLPSRRSTQHHSGRLVDASGRARCGPCSCSGRNGRYLPYGIGLGTTLGGGMPPIMPYPEGLRPETTWE